MTLGSISITGLLIVQSITLYLGLHYLGLWLVRRTVRINFWISVFCFTALAFQSSRTVHYLSDSPALASWMMSVGTAATFAMLLPLVTICQMVTNTPSGRVNQLLAIVVSVGIVLSMATPWMVSDDTRLHTDALGQQFYWVEPGFLIGLLPLCSLPALAYCGRLLLGTRQAHRYVLLGALTLYVAIGLNDLVAGAGGATVPLFEYGFLVLAMAFDYIAARSFQRLQFELETEVSARTLELSSANVALAESAVRAQSATKAKERFLAQMSHEVRTPLNGIIGLSGLLADSGLDQEQQQLCAGIGQSGRALLRLTNGILDFSKLEAGKIELEDTDFDLVAAVEDIVDLMAPVAQKKGLTLAHVVPEPGALLRGDVGRLRQILLNLVNNAVKFTESGHVVIRVSPMQKTARPTIRFAVEDTGIGIKPEAMEKIFEPFRQANRSTERVFGGTGLGLSISRHLVTALGGEMGVESRPGGGTRFWFTAVFQRTALECSRPQVSPGRILLISDDTVEREMMAAQLARCISEDPVASNAAQSVAKIEAAAATGEPFQVVFLDMDGVDGNPPESAARIQRASERNPLAVYAFMRPVVKVRGHQMDEDINGRLTKPVRHASLVRALRDVERLDTPTRTRLTTDERLAASVPGEPQRILVVEDNTINQMVVVRLLERMGYRVDVAGDGHEAVECAATFPYQAILMDCEMPRMDGYRATNLIRQRAPREGPHIPIIAMTAHAASGRERALAAGMDDYLCKPLDSGKLTTTLSHWCSRSGMPDVMRAGSARQDA